MASVTIRIDDWFKAQVATKAAKRGISESEAIRQILALGWSTWSDRGATERKRHHRTVQKAFRTRLAPGGHVLLPNDAEAILDAMTPNRKAWYATGLDGQEYTVPVKFIRPVPAEKSK